MKKVEFGGSLLVGKRKSRRPLKYNSLQHVVFKAVGDADLLTHERHVRQIISDVSAQVGVHILSCAVQPDHVHLAPVISDRQTYNRWVRATTGRLAQLIPSVKWQLRPYNRLVFDEAGESRLLSYIVKNQRESDFIAESRKNVANYQTLTHGYWEKIKKSNLAC